MISLAHTESAHAVQSLNIPIEACRLACLLSGKKIMQSWDSASCQLPNLKDLLLGVNSRTEAGYKDRFPRLKKLDRKLIGVFLAWSLFMLYGSPWLQQQWQDDVLILPYPSPNSGIDNRRPLIACTLSDTQGCGRRPQAEDVAALGVLILELEANAQAPWIDEDEDLETGERSNLLRLARILDDEHWVGELSDGYRLVAKSCLEFEAIVERSSLPGFKADLKSLAMLYKCRQPALPAARVQFWRGGAGIPAHSYPLGPQEAQPAAISNKTVPFRRCRDEWR